MAQRRQVPLTLAALLVGAALALPGTFAQAPAQESARTSAEIRIGLPANSVPDVAVETGERRLVVDLPRGSVFPIDFAASSGGLVRGGAVAALDDGRQRLELTMAAGYLSRVALEGGDLVLTFSSRLESSRIVDADDGGYRLGAGDKIAVTVHNQPDLGAELTVSRSGTITAPLVGEVDAAGRSPRELAGRLTELLGRSYLVDPQVDVAVTEYRSQWVMVTGEVNLPGRQPLRGGTRLKEVLSEAGGFRDTAGQEITVSRKLSGADEYEMLRISRRDFENGLQNPVLASGDIVDVLRASYCYIQGEVRSPSRVPIERGTTLLKAITLVGGLTEWADRKAVKILYPEGHEPRERLFNLKRIQQGKAEDPVLEGDEVIVVKRRFF